MKILFLSSWYPYPPDNGSRIRAYFLLQGLARAHAVTLIAFTDPDQVVHANELGALAHRVITLPRCTFQPARVRALAAFFSTRPRSIVDTFDSRTQKIIQDTARQGFDAIIACQLSTAVYARQLQHSVKIFDEAETGLYSDAFSNARGLARLRHGLTWFKYARFLKSLTRDFDAVTVVSANEHARLVQIGIPFERVHIVANGVDCRVSESTSHPPSPFTLIYNGALTYSANYDAMRYFVGEILPRIRAVEPRVSLKITGRAPQFAINELSQDNVVSFTGYVADVRAEVRSSAVCVVPLRMGGGTRLKILEAMAVGTPVVTTTKGAEGLDLTGGEHLLIADSPEDFARSTLALLSDESYRLRLAQAARARVRREYDWELIQQQMSDLVTRLVQTKRN